jgi:GT2 family glycosyltransferase
VNSGTAAVDASDVCVVVTTYADRSGLCRQVVERVLDEGVGRVLVVNNGAAPAAGQRLGQLEQEMNAVEILTLERNLGSAAGVAAGLSRFLTGCEFGFVWILDDDNVPRPGALSELLAWHERLPARGGLLAFRPSRPYQAALVSGRTVKEVYPSRSAYLSFSVMDLAHRLGRRRPSGVAGRRSEPLRIPYGAYGGLLLAREVVDRLGLPLEDLGLYEDDAEYTARLASVGLDLHLVPTAIVDDIDDNWANAGEGDTAVGRLITTPHTMRAFYSTRNRVFFESRYWCASPTLFRVNKSVWVVLLTVTALRRCRMGRLRMLLRAMRAGERGELGIDPDHPLAW